MFIGTKSAPNAVVVFPYFLIYRLSDSTLTTAASYLPLSTRVEFGAPKDGAHLVSVSSVSSGNNNVTVRFEQPGTTLAPFVIVRSTPERYEVAIDLPDVAVQPDLKLDAPAYDKDGLILSVSARIGDAGKGLTVVIAVNPAKWTTTTYNCDLSYGTDRFVRLNLYGDRVPTSLTPSVKR